MKSFLKCISLTIALIVVFNILPKSAFAQIDPGEDPDAPIDGGVAVLLAAGVGYGVKKYRENKQQQKAE